MKKRVSIQMEFFNTIFRTLKLIKFNFGKSIPKIELAGLQHNLHLVINYKKIYYIPVVLLLMVCNLSEAQNITVGNGQTLTITTNTTYTTLTVNNGGTLIVQAPATLTVGSVGNPYTTQVVDFQNGSVVNVNAGAFLVVYGKVNNSNNSDQVTIDGDLYIYGNYNGGGGSEIIGSGTVNSAGSMTTSNGGNPGLIFGSGSDCNTGPCSGNNLSCSLANTIATANQTICAGASAATWDGSTITSATYQWQSSTTGSSFANISGATNENYSPGVVSTTTYYRRSATKSGCTTYSPQRVVITTATVTPSVSISSSATTICSGTSITITATPTNGGTPTYQWKKGGVAISGATNSTYTTSTAANNDSYTVTMTSTATCPSPATATSSAIVITVSSVTPSVSISSSATTICSGTSITLTATPTNGGTPTYQWKKGGVAISGATNSTYTTSTAANNDSYTVTMTSTATCPSPATATSSAVIITVNPVLTPSVSIASSATTICTGASITITATPTNGGTPTYQWKKGGVAISGATNSTYTTAAAANNDSYTVTMTSTATCASPTTATSSAVVITVNTIPTISGTTPASRCGAGVVTLGATASAGTVNWYIASTGGTSVATGTSYSPTVSSTTTYYVDATNTGCTTGTRTSIVATIDPVPSVFIDKTTATICGGSSVSLTAAGDPGKSISFSGTNQYIKLNNDPLAAATDFTFEALIYWTNNATQWQRIFDFGNSTNVNMFFTTKSSSGFPRYAITTSGNGGEQQINTTTSITTNTWHHVAITYKASTTTGIMYLDGVAIGSNTSMTLSPASLTPKPLAFNYFGESQYPADPNFAGQMDEIRIWDVARTSTEINTNKNISVDPNSQDLVAYYKLNEGSGTTLTSVSGSSTATVVGSPTWVSSTASVSPPSGLTTTYSWSPATGLNTTSGATVTASPASDQTYTVTATYNNSCSSTATSAITVTPAPVAVAGTAISTCSTSGSVNITAGSSASNYSSISWSVNGTGTLANSNSLTNATYTPNAADISAGSRTITLTVNGNGSCSSVTSTKALTITTAVTPSVSISSSATTICAGASITLTATPTNGGTPTYQWKKGGVAISGATNATYTTTAAANNDSYTVTMTSTATCASPTTATSSAVVITVNPVLTPGVSASSSATTICAGASITLTATPTNGGTPTYQWNKGGVAISGATNATYTTTAAANNDSYTVTMTSTATCASPTTATSPAVVITVNPVLTPSVSISSSATTICAGASITLTATPTNGGTPTYQWNKDGVAISGATNATYTTTTAANNDSYTVTMTSTATCASPTTATSSAVVITVNPVLTPSVSISSSATTICAGTSITITATPTNGGTPTYQWNKGGVAISGATNATYTTTTAANNDSYTVTMNSTATCASPTTATSSAVVITVNAIPSITSVVPAARCGTGPITLSAAASAGSVKWYTVATNGISVYSGDNYTIPSLSATTTYYVEAVSNGCTSPSRTSVVATINTCSVSWIGVTSTDWTTASNWSYGFVPSASDTAIIPAGVPFYPAITTTVSIYKLNINSAASVSIASTGTLNIYGDLINDGTMSTVSGSTVAFKGGVAQKIIGVPALHNTVIDNTAGVAIQSTLTVNGTLSLSKGILTTNSNLTINFDNGGNIGYSSSDLGSISGTVTGRRDLVSAKTHYIGVPFSGVTSAQVAATTPLYVSPYWKMSTRAFSTQSWVAVTSLTTSMPLGTGYSLSLPAAAPLAFTGTYDHSFALTGPAYPNTATGKYLFVANPYPSVIDWDNASGWTKTNVGNAIYYWDAPNNRVASYVAGIGTNGATGYIPPMQAVLVALTGSGGTSSVSINNNARISNQNPAYMRTAAADAVIRIRIDGSNGIQNDETIVRFNGDATNNFDSGMDAGKILNGDSVPSIYTTSGSDTYSINSYSSPDAAPYIPLAVELPVDGKYTLTVSNDNPDIEYVLVDKQLGVEQTIKEAYSFTGLQTDDANRFELQLRTGTTTGVQGTSKTGGLAVNSAAGAGFYLQTQRYAGFEAEIEIMDVTGNRIMMLDNKNLSAGSTFIPLDLQSGAYLVKVHVNADTFAGMIVLVK